MGQVGRGGRQPVRSHRTSLVRSFLSSRSLVARLRESESESESEREREGVRERGWHVLDGCVASALQENDVPCVQADEVKGSMVYLKARWSISTFVFLPKRTHFIPQKRILSSLREHIYTKRTHSTRSKRTHFTPQAEEVAGWIEFVFVV